MTNSSFLLYAPCSFEVAMGFFGLDQLGAELEQPFGTEENNLNLLLVRAKILSAGRALTSQLSCK